jgi:hypothetical protein
MTLLMNAVAIWIRYRFRKKINGDRYARVTTPSAGTTRAVRRLLCRTKPRCRVPGTPKISIAVDDTRQLRTLNVKARSTTSIFYYGHTAR